MPHLGTRTKSSFTGSHPEHGALNGSLTGDKGMNKLVTASVTFSAGSGRATAAATTFANFATRDEIMVQGASLNNGFYTVLATDASTYLTLDPPPKNEGPITVTIRTP